MGGAWQLFSYVLSNSEEVFTIFGPNKKIIQQRASVTHCSASADFKSELKMCCCQIWQTNLLDLSAKHLSAGFVCQLFHGCSNICTGDPMLLHRSVMYMWLFGSVCNCGTLVQICSSQQTSCTCRFVAPESCCLHSTLTFQET